MADGTEMDVVSMARTAAEKKAAEVRWKEGPTAEGEDYPYGLCICLGKDELAKLGITSLPEVGQSVTVYAQCEVTSVRQSASKAQNEDTMSVDLQITAMAAQLDSDDDEAGETSAAAKLYPSSK